VRSSWRRSSLLVAAITVLFVTYPAGAEPISSPPHSIPDGLSIFSISCVGLNSCTAVGSDDSPDPLVITESSGQWSLPETIELPDNADNVADGGGAIWEDVSCWSRGDCVAGGSYTAYSTVGVTGQPQAEPMVAVETDGSWNTAEEIVIPQSSNSEFGEIGQVSCDSEGDCTALGVDSWISETTGDFDGYVFATSETGGTSSWSPPTVFSSPGPSSDNVQPVAISCSSATSCGVLEVLYDTNFDYEGEYVTNDVAGTWSTPELTPRSDGHVFEFDSLACPSDGSCVAV
jgi:hypothetical protein